MNATLPTLQTANTVTAGSLTDREGFDEQFLGVPVPVPALAGVATVLLPYTHFSVLMRLAAITALGIDGGKLMDIRRSGIEWRLDPRLDEDLQTGERVYARNAIDRGHLVRRASAIWGDTRAEAATANEDTFHYTNAAPQAAKFNQGLELWLGYGIRPSARGRGLATWAVGRIVEEARMLGIDRVLAVCKAHNTASARTIERQGGSLDKASKQGDALRYWIDTSLPRV